MTTAEAPPASPRKRSSRRAGSHPTVADVARAAGVSPMTVSRVVNGSASVQADTRARVEEVIARIGYVPNPAARALAGARQVRIALLYDNPSAVWLSELLVGCLAQAAGDNAQIVVQSSLGHAEPEALAAALAGARVDGAILPPPLGDDAAIVAALRARGIALVLIATGAPQADIPCVRIDDFAAALAMTRYILARGHRRIGFIRGNANQAASARRLAGFEAGLAEAGLSSDPGLVAQGDFSWRSGLDAAEALLALEPPPQAIFASNDDMAAAAISAAHRKGLEVPGDLAVYGFDDTAIATMIWPGLTTIRQPVADMAREATDILARAIREAAAGNAPEARQVIVPFDLIERDSG